MKRKRTIFDLITLSDYEQASINATFQNVRDAIAKGHGYYAELFARRLAQLASGPLERGRWLRA